MLLGLRTVRYKVGDIDRAEARYSSVFGITPYFDAPDILAATVRDPFGNIIEIYTHNYETLYGGMKVGESDAK